MFRSTIKYSIASTKSVSWSLRGICSCQHVNAKKNQTFEGYCIDTVKPEIQKYVTEWILSSTRTKRTV